MRSEGKDICYGSVFFPPFLHAQTGVICWGSLGGVCAQVTHGEGHTPLGSISSLMKYKKSPQY